MEKFEFKNFIEQFNYCSANIIWSNYAKLSYLRSLLTNCAFSIINHLTINDPNFATAVDLLKVELLDMDFIVDKIFHQLILILNIIHILQELNNILLELEQIYTSFIVL